MKRESYFSKVTYDGKFKTLDDFSKLGQEWSEELANYFDDSYKAQMESLLMLLNMAYELGVNDGKLIKSKLLNDEFK